MRSKLTKNDLVAARESIDDNRAANQLLERLYPRIQGVVRMIVRGEQDQNDLVQLCLMEILENLDNYRGEGSIDSWAGQLSYYVVLRNLKKSAIQDKYVKKAWIEKDAVTTNPEQETARSEAWELLFEHMNEIPTKRRVPLILHLVHGYTVPEVAQMTETSHNTIKDRLRTGFNELREIFVTEPALRPAMKWEQHSWPYLSQSQACV